MNDPKALANALRNYSAKFDLVGPSVDDDIRRAVLRYGAEAVKAAVKRQTKSKVGRKPEQDWPDLMETIFADAKIWLAGADPFEGRSNYAIAKDFADRKPGQSATSTHQRIERKLKQKPYDRRWRILAFAEYISREGYPHAAHLRALEELAKAGAGASAETWSLALEAARATLDDYEQKTGQRPPAELSMKQIEEVVRNAFTPVSNTKPGGLFALSLHAHDKGLEK